MSEATSMNNHTLDDEMFEFDLSIMPKEPLGFLDLIVYDYHLRRNHVSTASAFVVESQVSRTIYEKMASISSQSLLEYWFLNLFPYLIASMDQNSPINKAKHEFLKKLMFEAEASSEDASKSDHNNDSKKAQVNPYNGTNREHQGLSGQNSNHFQHSNQVTPSMNENKFDDFTKQLNKPLNTTLPPNAIPLKEWTNASTMQQQTPSAKQTPVPMPSQQNQFNNAHNQEQVGKPSQGKTAPQTKKRVAAANINKVLSPSGSGQNATSQAQQPNKQRRNTGQTPKQTPKQVKSIPPPQPQPTQRPSLPMVAGGNQPNFSHPHNVQMGVHQPNIPTSNQHLQQIGQPKIENKEFPRPPQGAPPFAVPGQVNGQMTMPNMARMKSNSQIQGPGEYLAFNMMDPNQLNFMMPNQKQMNMPMQQGAQGTPNQFIQAPMARGPVNTANFNPSLGRPAPNGWNPNQANIFQSQLQHQQQQFMHQRFINSMSQQPGQNPNFMANAYGRGNPNPGMIPGNQPSSLLDQNKQPGQSNHQMTPKQSSVNPNVNPNQRPQPTMNFNGQVNPVAMQMNQMANNMANQGNPMQGQVNRPNQGQIQSNMDNPSTVQQQNVNASGSAPNQPPQESRAQAGPPFQQPPASGSNPYNQMFLSFESLSGMNTDLGLDLNFGQASNQPTSTGFGNEVNPFASGINPFNLFVNDGINMGLIDQMNNQPFGMNLEQNNVFFQQNNTNQGSNASVSTPFTPQTQGNQGNHPQNGNPNPQQSPFNFQPTLGSNNHVVNPRTGSSTSLVHSVLDHADELTNSLESIMGIDPFGNQANERSTPRRS